MRSSASSATGCSTKAHGAPPVDWKRRGEAMRSIVAVLALCAALAPGARAAEVRNFSDAPLHAVQFVDTNEGWAVGDEGVVWHTIDGGQNWERQPTPTRASLR